MSVHLPRASIGMPLYNGERYVRAAIDSILAQTFTDFELVISDNGSTDKTEEICRSYAAADPRVRYFRSDRNRGISWNFDQVFHLSTGQYFRWHAYDDLCAPELLELCVGVLDRMPSVVLCYGRTVIIDQKGAVVRTYTEDLDLHWSNPYRRYRHFHFHYRYGGLCNVHYGLMRRDVLQQTRLMAPYVDSDVVLIGELALRGAFHEIPQPLFLRRDHPQISIRAFPTPRARVALLDPSLTVQRVHPLWRLFAEHLATISRVPMSRYDRMRCYALMGRYAGWKTRLYLANLVRKVR